MKRCISLSFRCGRRSPSILYGQCSVGLAPRDSSIRSSAIDGPSPSCPPLVMTRASSTNVNKSGGVAAIRVEKGGYCMVQDFPARVGYWRVGVPPSGPMDPLSFRLVNRLVGNDEGAAGLEITFSGPTLVFESDAVIALGGARIPALLDGAQIDFWKAVRVHQGQRLEIGDVSDSVAGARTYLAISGGGIAGEPYLGSLATFPNKFGSTDKSGALLSTGQVLSTKEAPATATSGVSLAPELIPQLTREWEIGVVPGPQEAPDYLTKEDVELLYSTQWTVSDAASRLGVRLIGPKVREKRRNGRLYLFLFLV